MVLLMERAASDEGQLALGPQPRLVEVVAKLTVLLEPLAEAANPAELEAALAARLTAFRQLRAALEEIFWPTWADLSKRGLLTFQEAERFIQDHASRLGEPAAEQLAGALSSLEGFTGWLLRSAAADQREVYRRASVLQEVGRPALYAEMCLNAALGILQEQYPRAKPTALATLAQAADDYMTQVEDVFLAESHPAESDDAETVDYETVKASLGL